MLGVYTYRTGVISLVIREIEKNGFSRGSGNQMRRFGSLESRNYVLFYGEGNPSDQL